MFLKSKKPLELNNRLTFYLDNGIPAGMPFFFNPIFDR